MKMGIGGAIAYSQMIESVRTYQNYRKFEENSYIAGCLDLFIGERTSELILQRTWYDVETPARLHRGASSN